MLKDTSSNKLSAVLEKQIHRLCLNDFPLGHGTWTKTKDRTEAAETDDADALLDLLRCPHSPWRHDEPWSPQAAALRELAVLAPERLHKDLIYNHFTTLRIVDESVSVIDDGLLKFSKLEELVLSDNQISQMCSENLPSTLKILDVRANRLSALNSLTNRPPPCLQYLSLGSNRLGSHEDVRHLTGRHWPQLVCLDLSNCEFEDQQALLGALSTLPSLRTLVLEGNPFTLAPSYPGFTVDTLPRLSCLDTSWISAEERHRFRGFAKNDVAADWASCTVSVAEVRGIPDPLARVDESIADFPVVNYGYFITYEFLSHQAVTANADAAHVREERFGDADLQSNRNCGKESSKPNTHNLLVDTEETCHDVAYGVCAKLSLVYYSDVSSVSAHSTSKLPWSGCMDFSHTQTYIVTHLGDLKRFFNRGFYLTIEEEKVLSWPAASEDVPSAKPGRPVKEKKSGKGKESPIKSGSTKDKKRKCAPELVQDAPIRRILGSVHICLQSLLTGGQKVNVLCDLGALHSESEVDATQTPEEDLGKKIKEDKKSKQRGGSGTRQKNTAASKGKGKGRQECEMDVHTDISVTVEVNVELEKWRSPSEAHQLLLPQQNSLNKRPVLS
uniref:leucine-rich repeat-containing protein 43-like isoform X1 n=1 Tax=Gasterosteus aculeatus aculeatus TaxID=481459 RepID=UPI001A991109|nr:leucine-rich repeat-containing protein 43-like isoform X1 [Gasterosteus aculeatus aculeatus]